MPDAAPSRELLLASHAFPGEYILKAFGPGTDEFREAVHAVAARVVGTSRVTSSERSTRTAHRICITLVLTAESVDDVIAVYNGVSTIPDLMILL